MAVIAVVLTVCVAMTSVSCQDLPYTYPNESRPGTEPLYFGLLQSFGGSYNSSGSIPGIEMALDRINEDQELLPGYTLHYFLRDSYCERTTALESLHQLLFQPPTKLAILGSGCSIATEPTAEVDHYYNVTHLSCVSSSQALSNRTRYRAYYQMLPSESDIALAYYGVIKEYGWQHIAFIVENQQIFTLTVETLTKLLDRSKVTYSMREFETRSGISALGNDLFDSNARIFMIATFPSHAGEIICEARKRGFRYPQYMFLTYGWYPPQWWLNKPSGTCGGIDVLRFTLAFLHFPFVRFVGLDEPTDVNVTGRQYEEIVNRDYFNRPPLFLDVIEGSSFCYDATWTLARALSQTLKDLADPEFQEAAANASQLYGSSFSLQNFTYTNDVIRDSIFSHLAETDFTGITGEVKFGENGTRDVEALRVLQIREDSNGEYNWVKIGTVMFDTQVFSFVNGMTNESVFPEGLPYDGVPRREVDTIHPSLTAIVALLVAVGLTFSVVCIVFNIVYRKRKLIRLSSPWLNLIICVGAIVLYLGMVLIVVPSTDQVVVSVLCNLSPWFTSIGYSLCYGTMLVKMFRVYYIYSNPSPNKKKHFLIQDTFLILMVCCLVIIDVLILLLYEVLAGLNGNLEADLLRNAENKESIQGAQRIIVDHYVYVCNSEEREVFLGILYGYKSLLQVLALFLAFATRRVKIRGLNDAKSVAAAVYITSLTFTVAYVCTFTVVRYINVYAAIFSLTFFIGTTSILGLLYIPNMVILYKDPEGLTVFAKSDPTGTVASFSDRSTIETLRRRIRELETQLQRNSASPNPNFTQQFLLPPSDDRRSTISNISLGTGSEVGKTLWDPEPLPQGNGSGKSLADATDAADEKTEQNTNL